MRIGSRESEFTHRQMTQMRTISPDNPWSDYVGFGIAEEIFRDTMKESDKSAPDTSVIEMAGRASLNGVGGSYEQDVRAV